jgi:hypothetical protein
MSLERAREAYSEIFWQTLDTLSFTFIFSVEPFGIELVAEA